MDTVVVKVGGSIALYPEKLKVLCQKLSEISKTHSLIIVPGGGEFADIVRVLDKRFKLSPEVAHRMAILGMDQYGLLLSNLIANSCVVNSFEMVQETSASGKLPVFLLSTLLFKADPLKNSWDVTSDSIAAYVSGQLHVNRVVLLTDVDGVYTCDPKNSSDAKLIPHLSTSELLKMNTRSSIDKFLPKLLLQFHLKCFVVNGFCPERVEAVLDGKETVCTAIT